MTLFAVTAGAQTGNVVVGTNTVWADGGLQHDHADGEQRRYTDDRRGLIGNGVRRSAGDCELEHRLCRYQHGGVATQENPGAGSGLSGGTIQVDAGSSINADSQGYIAGVGPGSIEQGQGAAATVARAAVWLTPPTTAMRARRGASALAGGQAGGVGGAGGGAISLIANTGITLNGSGLGNGGSATGAAGGGAGGSIFISINGYFNGAGTVSANGGSNTTGAGSGGRGGCIAELYTTGTSQQTLLSWRTAVLRPDTGLAGSPGCVFFAGGGSTDPIYISKNSFIQAGDTISFNDLTVGGGATLTLGGGATLSVTKALVVTANSSIVVQGAKYLRAGWWRVGGCRRNHQRWQRGAGRGQHDQRGSAGLHGAKRAGSGRKRPGRVVRRGRRRKTSSALYGSASAPVALGSGGGSYESIGGTGGGAITMNVSGTFTNNGIVSAKGGTYIVCTGSGACGGGLAGGGAGGSVYVTAGAITGNGNFDADGGPNASGGGNGGGGGRVAVYYGSAGGYSGFISSTANGGAVTGNNTAGQAGTVGFFLTSGSSSEGLNLYDNYTIPAGTTMTYTSLTVQNGATLTVGGGSTLNVTGALLVTGNSNIVLQGANTSAQVNGAWAGVGSTLNAASVEVDAGSTINADAQGYTASSGPGGASGSSYGGSYGGAGGGLAVTTTYGSATLPTDLGSGGGSYESTGGTGGGAVRIVASGTVLNNGVISANGGTFIVCTGSGACGGGFAGGGAGGSVSITAGALTGNGSFHADGGPNTSSYGDGGGGGRVAVYYNATQSSFTGFAASTASGGVVPTNNGAIAGSNGTIAFFDTSATNSNVSVYQNYVIPAASNVQYNSLTATNASTITVGGGSTIAVAGSVLVTQNSKMILQSANTTAQVSGHWAGVGEIIQAGSLEVDAGSTINADAQGYSGLNGPGAGASSTSNGGSYGGAGGGQAATTTYGSASAPTDIGSGGGQYQGTTAPGGGAIHLIVAGTLTDNGIISANAAPACCFVGGSAGGSVYVTTGTLTGSGTFNANGGNNTSQYGQGGGGGRVAVYSTSASGFTGFTASTATGGTVMSGSGGIAGANGTVGFFDTSVANSNLHVYQNYALAANTTTSFNSLSLASGGTFTLGGNANLIVAQTLDVAGTMTAQSVNNTGTLNGTYQGKGVEITAGTMTVESTGVLTADSMGYGPVQGPGAGVGGTSDGGSYGGLGGGQTATSLYGSQTAPIDLGSGGAQYQGTAGVGGGAIQLNVSGTLTDNGVITANGQTIGGFVGAGSGGSIYVSANTIAGTGTLTGNGGGNTTQYGDGGGGGRVAVYYANAATLSQANVTAAGGASTGTPGAVGDGRVQAAGHLSVR